MFGVHRCIGILDRIMFGVRMDYNRKLCDYIDLMLAFDVICHVDFIIMGTVYRNSGCFVFHSGIS